MILRASLCAFIFAIISFGCVSQSFGQDIVLYASQAPVKVGNWSSVGDGSAAGGSRLANPDAGAPKRTSALASPTDYFEMTFSAAAGTDYRLWIRGKAQNDSWANDSAFVQFSDSVNSNGSAVFRIGTTSATEFNLEECSGCGIQGWGWQDNGWGVGVLGPPIRFANSGTHTIRIQVREDGLSIDQIVLSPSTYLYNSPGAPKNDGVILPAPTPPSGGESPNNTRVPPGTQIVDSNGAVWTLSNGTILRNGAGTGGAGSQILYCNRIVYAFGTDSQWYRWSNGWIAIGATDPCGGSTPSGESPNNTRVPPSTQIVDSNLDVWTLSNGVILRNGAGTGGAGSQILYCNRIVYAFGTDSQWYRWNNGWTAIGATDPCDGATPTPTPTPTPPQVNQPPQVSVSASPTSGSSPLFVSFSSSAVDLDGYVASYSWNFADGTTSNLPNPTHTFQSPGTYPVYLQVTDNSQATTTKGIQINVISPTPPSSSQLRVMSWNMNFGTGTDGVTNFDRTTTRIANFNPDLIALCEVPVDQVGTIVNLLNQKTGMSWSYYYVAKWAGYTEGNLILSKYSFVSTNLRYLSYSRSVAQATINVGGRTINFFATHLDPDSSSVRYQQVGELMSWASGFSESRIIAGDFNAGPDTSESIRMTGSYYDGWMQAMGAGMAVAYPDNPVWAQTRTRRGRIDYIFYSLSTGNLVLKGMQVPDVRDLSNPNVTYLLGTLDDKGVRPSDHNPTIVTFDVR